MDPDLEALLVEQVEVGRRAVEAHASGDVFELARCELRHAQLTAMIRQWERIAPAEADL